MTHDTCAQDLRPAGHHAVGAAGGAVGGAGTCTMLYAYDAAQNKDHFTVAQGETLQVTHVPNLPLDTFHPG